MALSPEDLQKLQQLKGSAQADAEAPRPPEERTLSTQELQKLKTLKETARDPVTGDQKPNKFSGVDPDSAMSTEKVLGSFDRFKIEVGNEIGTLNNFKNDPRFEDAAYNEAGALTIKKNGKWYLADPDVDDLSTPWDRTRELVDDVLVDSTRELMVGVPAIAAGTVAAPTGPGGAAMAAGTAAYLAEHTRTSLGRALGTYQADQQTQIRDSAIEMLMELIPGVKFLPGVRPTAKLVTNGLKKTAKKLKDPAQKGANALWDFYGSLATSPEVTRTFRESPDEVIGVTNRNKKLFQMPAEFINKVTKEKVNIVSDMSKQAEKYVSDSYKILREKVTSKVPNSFEGSAEMYAASAYADFLDQGMSKLLKPVKGGGVEVVTDPKEFANTLQWIKENGRVPRGWKVQMKSQNEVRQLAESGLEVDTAIRRAAVNEDAYKAIKEAHDTFAGFQTRPKQTIRGGQSFAARGKEQANKLLEDKKNLSNLLYGIADDPKLASMGDVTSYINRIRSNTDKITKNHLKKYNADELFEEMNGVYSKYQDELMPFIDANRRAKKKGATVYETLMNQLSQKEGKQVVRKDSLEEVISLAERMGDKKAVKYFSSFDKQLRVRDAAIALNPYVTKRTATFGMTTYAVMSVNAALAATMGITTAATSPGLQRRVLGANKSLWNALKSAKGMTKQQIEFLGRNPQAATAIIRSTQSAGELYNNVGETFNQMFPQIPLRGAGDTQ